MTAPKRRCACHPMAPMPPMALRRDLSPAVLAAMRLGVRGGYVPIEGRDLPNVEPRWVTEAFEDDPEMVGHVERRELKHHSLRRAS